MIKIKVALVVGHNSKSQGSSGALGSEFNFFKGVADRLKERFEVDVYERVDKGSYSKEMQEVVDKLNSKPYDLVVELHYNGFDGTARGCESLYWHSSTKGKDYSEKFCNVVKNHDIPFRRLIPIKAANERGGYGIAKCKHPYILVEPFFGDNKEDVAIIKNEENMSKIIGIFLAEIGVVSKDVEPSTPGLESAGKLEEAKELLRRAIALLEEL